MYEHLVYGGPFHRRRKVYNIGGPRFRILGGGGKGPRGPIPSRHMTS